MLIEAEIEKQFVTGKRVMDAHRGLLKDAFKAKAYVEFDGEDRIIYMKDKGQDMPIADYFEYWKNLADSKVYLEGDVPTGSGATGSKGGFKKPKGLQGHVTQGKSGILSDVRRGSLPDSEERKINRRLEYGRDQDYQRSCTGSVQ